MYTFTNAYFLKENYILLPYFINSAFEKWMSTAVGGQQKCMPYQVCILVKWVVKMNGQINKQINE